LALHSTRNPDRVRPLRESITRPVSVAADAALPAGCRRVGV